MEVETPVRPGSALPLLEHPQRQIRLLSFARSDNEDEIHVGVSIWSLDRIPLFNAISYTWGSPQYKRTVHINGVACEVHQNCHAALSQTRQYSPTALVWIDSICINQDDDSEKGSQVRMMGDISALAERVLMPGAACRWFRVLDPSHIGGTKALQRL